MHTQRLVAVSVVFLAVCVLGQAQSSGNSTTIPATTPSVSQAADNTTLTPPTTEANSTGKTAPPPITGAPLSSNTTVEPSSSTTTPAPLLDFPKNIGKWFVTEENITCIRFEGAIRLWLHFNNTQNKSNQTSINVPASAVPSGICSSSQTTQMQTLKLTWPSIVTAKFNSIQFTFAIHHSKEKTDYSIESVSAVIHKDSYHFFNASDPNTPLTLKLHAPKFVTLTGQSYKCNSTIAEDKSDISFGNMQMEAFGTSNSHTFSKAAICDADATGLNGGEIAAIVLSTIFGVILFVIGGYVLYQYKKKGFYHNV